MTITRRLEFDAGHRLLMHESKCRHVHGHRYVAEITCAAEQLDQVGRVIDFSVVKELVGAWLDAHWDHAFIAQRGDPIIFWLVEHRMHHEVIAVPPTAENLVMILKIEAQALLLDRGIVVTHMRLYETPNCWADA